MADHDPGDAREWAERVVSVERDVMMPSGRLNAARTLLALLEERECAPIVFDDAEGRPGTEIVMLDNPKPSIRRLSQGEMMVWAAEYIRLQGAGHDEAIATGGAAKSVCTLRDERWTDEHVEAFARQVLGG